MPQHIIDSALATDSSRALAEYMCEWRSDLSDFIPHDVVEAATDFGIYERAPVPHVQYYAHADAAGGTGTDSFALAISHKKDSSYVIDVVREFKPRFTPAAVIGELAALVKSYGVTKVHGDKYAIGFHSAEWKTYGIEFVPCENSTSENYLTCLPILLAGRVRLIDNRTLRNQLTALERKPGDFAREQVSHPQHSNAHDDVACCVAGAIVATTPRDGSYSLDIWRRAFGNPFDDTTESLVERSRKAYIQTGSFRVPLGDGSSFTPNTEVQYRLLADIQVRIRAEAERKSAP